MLKVRVGRQKHKLVPDTQLSDQRVDRAGLNPALAASIAELSCSDMIVTVWIQERKGSEVLDYLHPGLGTREPLEKLLKDQPRRENSVTPINGTH